MPDGWTHVERLAATMAAAGPLIGTAAPEEVAATLGWRTAGAFGAGEILAGTGIPGGESVALLFPVGNARRVFTGARVTLTESAGAAAAIDAFADVVSVLRPRLDRFPVERPGARPAVTWRVGRIDGSRLPWRRRHAVLTVSREGGRVDLTVRAEQEATDLAAAATAEAARAEAALAPPGDAHAAPGTGWERFTVALADELAELGPGHVIILAGPGPENSFVQFMQFGDGEAPYLTAETVSDHFRDDDRALTPDQLRQLAALGWDAPQESNWSHHLAWPARWDAYERLARMAVGALRDVHGIRTPADLDLGGWGYDDGLPAPYPRLRP